MLRPVLSRYKQSSSMDRTKILDENEWLELLEDEMQGVEITESNKRHLAHTLAYHFMTIDDAIQLTHEQLVSFLNRSMFVFPL